MASIDDELKKIRTELTVVKSVLSNFKISGTDKLINIQLNNDNAVKFTHYFIKDKVLEEEEKEKEKEEGTESNDGETNNKEVIPYNEKIILNYKEYEDKLNKDLKLFLQTEIRDKLLKFVYYFIKDKELAPPIEELFPTTYANTNNPDDTSPDENGDEMGGGGSSGSGGNSGDEEYEEVIPYNEDVILNYKESEDARYEELKKYLQEEIYDKLVEHLNAEIYDKLVEHITTNNEAIVTSISELITALDDKISGKLAQLEESVNSANTLAYLAYEHAASASEAAAAAQATANKAASDASSALYWAAVAELEAGTANTNASNALSTVNQLTPRVDNHEVRISSLENSFGAGGDTGDSPDPLTLNDN